MRFIYQLNDIDDYLEICKRALEGGLLPGDDMSEYVHKYCEEKNIKPLGTELTNEELIADYKSKGLNVKDFTEDKNGESLL